MKITSILFLILALLFFSIPAKTIAGPFPNIYYFDFDPTLVPEGTLLRDHPDIISADERLIIRSNRIESDYPGTVTMSFNIPKVSNFLELTIDIERGFWLCSTYGRGGIRFFYVDAFGTYHYLVRVNPYRYVVNQTRKIHIQLKHKNGKWYSRYKFYPQNPIWTNWTIRRITDKNTINNISKTFGTGTWHPIRLKINDIKVFTQPDWVPPDFDLFMFPYDKEGTTIIRTPNYVLNSILHTDFAIYTPIPPPPLNKFIDEIRLVMYDTKTGEIRYLIKYPRDLPYQVYIEPPPPDVPAYIHMDTTMINFRPSTWLLLGYKIFWMDGFVWYFPEWDNHTFIIKDGHLTKPLPPPERPELPDIIPPILFPTPPPPEPEPEAILDRLVWRIEGFLRTMFIPSPDAINNLNYEILRLQHRFPINYINETRKFFKTLTYTPTNPHPIAITMAFPIIGREATKIEILNFDWINNPVNVFGISTTIANLLKSLTSFFIVILFITFTIAIIKIIL